ncbi:MAG TPA: nucleoside monophosphate kinase [Planctomycetaceae bacterium]|nr:nucleoside monophosphate kinase [Planctomycetaceae bacterium]
MTSTEQPRKPAAAGSFVPRAAAGSSGDGWLYPALLLFGAPGVGKGTQGAILGHIPGFFHLSMGDIFRALDPDSSEGKQARRHFLRGELVPDELTIRIWKRGLDQRIDSGAYHPEREILVLDGIPRNPNQSELLKDTIDVRVVVHLAASDEELMIRRIRGRALAENRPDDADEAVIRRRFEVYHAETEPVLRYYPPEQVATVDALGTPVEVLRRLLDVIIPVQKQLSPDEG